ncbi:MoaF-related domain-containing protein [Streptomyces sp. NPDC050121]|uniref:MoaF-related domain-containing protein n=1 Tax=Streptomyces sp. NPDC050121 TaxID=3365601 RepID=UPI0037ADD585
MSNLTYAGKTYRFSVDNGVVFHNAYSPDGTTLHYETVAGPTAGASEDVTLHAAEAAPGVFLLGWVEKSGMTVTHAMNLNTLTVHAFWTYDTPEGRIGELHVGSLEEI